MQSAGKVVDKVGGLGPQKKARSLDAKSEALASSFPAENQVRKLVEILEQKELAALLPNLAGKKVIQATTSTNRLWEGLQQKGADFIIDLDMGNFEGNLSSTKPPKLQRIKGSLAKSPFPDQSMDYLLLLGAGIRRENPSLWMKEIARILKDNSRMILSFIHPFLEYQFHPGSGFTHRVDQYFMALKKAEIYVEDMKECLADDALKSAIGAAKNDKNFAQLKDFPLLLIFKGIRLKRR